MLIVCLLCRSAPGQDSGSALSRAAQGIFDRQVERAFRSMNRPAEPFRVIGNIYYVGAREISSFLIVTPEGHILIDSGFEETVPLVRDGVRKLGFRFEDIKILLNSHAHVDHAGGHALLKEMTGARIVMSARDAELLAQGGRGDVLPLSEELVAYRPALADRIVGDGDQVRLGGVVLNAHLTPGHTKGCTTWTTTVEEGGKRLDVVFFGSTTLLPGVRLIGDPRYPNIADDFARTFGVLKALPCDVFLAPHGAMFGLEGKARRLASGARPNPFIDPEGYKSFIDRAEQAFLLQLEREKAAGAPSSRSHPEKKEQP